MDDRPTFARLLRRHREVAGFTQEELAERALLSNRAVSDLERGVRLWPHPSTVRLLAAALALSAAETAAFTAASVQRSSPPARTAEDLAETSAASALRRGAFPVSLTTFVGREREIVEVTELLRTTRLVTLTGTGGCGKTRLAAEVATRLRGDYPDGVWFVDLAPLSDAALTPQAVLLTLHLREIPDRWPLEALAEHLRSKRLLLLLDNCEHLLAACAGLAETLLHSCPQLRLMATSREPLGVASEVTWRTPSLTLPNPGEHASPKRLADFEAVRLFEERARRADSQFAVTDQNAVAVAEICLQLDGIPLAIELAAARVGVLSVEQIAARLDDRFHLLTGGSRTALPRQQTLRATMDWSYDLLGERERLLFARFSVFAGDFTLEAAEAVGGGDGVETLEVLDLMGRLVDKSLVIAEEHADEERYRLLETPRQYAWGRLVEIGSVEAIQERHAAYYLSAGEQAQWLLENTPSEDLPESVEARARNYLIASSTEKRTGIDVEALQALLQPEFDNLRLALRWLLARGDVERSQRLVLVMGALWEALGYLSEGRERLLHVLALEGPRSPLRGEVLRDAGWLCWRQGDYPAARSYWTEDLAIRRGIDDRLGIAFSLNWLGVVARDQGDYVTARSTLTESLALYRALDNRQGVSDSLARLGSVAHILGDLETAHAQFEESLAIRQELGDRRAVAWISFCLGLLALDRGDITAAQSRYLESMPLFRSSNDKRAVLHALALGSTLAAATSRADHALRLAGAISALSDATTVRLPVPYHDILERWLDGARRSMSEEAAAAAWAEGQAMTLEQAVALAHQEDFNT